MGKALQLRILLGAIAGIVLSNPIQTQDQQVLENLVAYDQAFLSLFDLSLEATYPTTAFDITQGYCTAQIEVAGDGTQTVLNNRQIRRDPPRFASDRLTRDYGENGDYNLSFTKSLWVHLGPDSWKLRIEQEDQSINSGNLIVRTTQAAPIYEVRSVGDQDAKNRLYRYLLPLGRGFSELLSHVTSVTTLSDRSLKVLATGSLFSPNSGEWELDVDPEIDYIVRSATFTLEGSKEYSTVVCDQDAGVSKNELTLWNRGTFQLTSDYDISVRLISFTNETDATFLGEVKAAVDTINPNSTLIDFSALDSSGRPLVVNGVGATE